MYQIRTTSGQEVDIKLKLRSSQSNKENTEDVFCETFLLLFFRKLSTDFVMLC